MALLDQGSQQPGTSRLSEGFSASDTDMAGLITANLFENVVKRPAFPSVEGVSGVTINASQGATSQAHKHRRPTHRARLAL